jgi:23S rRNA (pseudouridine1915-N3)-methyltransferase
MNLHILAVGKKKSVYDEQIAEYKKRITAPFSMSIEIIEPSGKDTPEQSKIKEGEKLISKIKPGDHIIALDERGKDFTTIDFAKIIAGQLSQGPKRIVFVIGGAYGLDKVISDKASLIMRISSMTLPHELARLMLAEQCYRATNYLSGGKYHHQ